ncbi:hypothetical protein H7U05_03675 [Priestia megaterium]|uniref:hypothetical protein n=1 Tax=Priestia megaterium TaxID=1404 RepID=UPI001C8D925C|nr:hypothetical protein [Priestia megaterium]MBY0196403.1 hypothetical protein [Priestia megaterium]
MSFGSNYNANINEMMENRKRMLEEIAENKRRSDQVQIDQLQSSKNIEKALEDIQNSMPEIISLVRENNDTSKEMFALFQEMNTIMTAQSEEEAKHILETVTEKAQNISDKGEAAKNLYGYGKFLFMCVKEDIKSRFGIDF